jgi:hypothetical protein
MPFFSSSSSSPSIYYYKLKYYMNIARIQLRIHSHITSKKDSGSLTVLNAVNGEASYSSLSRFTYLYME